MLRRAMGAISDVPAVSNPSGTSGHNQIRNAKREIRSKPKIQRANTRQGHTTFRPARSAAVYNGTTNAA